MKEILMPRAFIVYSLLFVLTGCATYDHQSLYQQKPGYYSYIVGRVDNDQPDNEHGAAVATCIASCQKTITALLALKTLGSDYRFTTELYTHNKNGKIHDAVIRFGGDPTMTTGKLILLLQPLQGKTLPGGFIVDDSLWQIPEHSPYIMIEDVGASYAPPLSSAIIDNNTIHLTLAPSHNGGLAQVTANVDYSIDNKVMTNDHDTSFTVTWDEQRIAIKGAMNYGDQPRTVKITPPHSHDYIMLKIRNIMAMLHIKADVHMIMDPNQYISQGIIINTVTSEPLRTILPPAMARSDNLVFDSLYLTIFNHHNHKPMQTWKSGDELYKQLLQQYFNLDMNQAYFIDGSGLSRLNRIQPRQLWQLLRQAHTMPDFINSLPNPGTNLSTVAKRNNLDTALRVKTGSMSGISCLCGYDEGLSTPKVFVIIANSVAPPAHETQTVMDKFIMHKLRDE